MRGKQKRGRYLYVKHKFKSEADESLRCSRLTEVGNIAPTKQR